MSTPLTNLSRNNFAPDDVGAGEAEQGVVGAERLLEADEDFAEAVDPTVADFHNPASGDIARVVFAEPALMVLGMDAWHVAVADHLVPGVVTQIAGIRVQTGLQNRIGNNRLYFG